MIRQLTVYIHKHGDAIFSLAHLWRFACQTSSTHTNTTSKSCDQVTRSTYESVKLSAVHVFELLRDWKNGCLSGLINHGSWSRNGSTLSCVLCGGHFCRLSISQDRTRIKNIKSGTKKLATHVHKVSM